MSAITLDDGGPAFPHGPLGDSRQHEDGLISHQFAAYPGMSLRDWFAGLAMQGLIAEGDERTVSPDIANNPERVEEWRRTIRLSEAKCCYKMADAMLKAAKLPDLAARARDEVDAHPDA